MENQQMINQQLPNSTTVLVLGILSIVFCMCYGFVGVVLGVIALVLASKASKLYNSSPGQYSEGSYKNMKAGKVCAIIGLSLSSLYLIYFIIIISFYGALLTSLPWEEILNQY